MILLFSTNINEKLQDHCYDYGIHTNGGNWYKINDKSQQQTLLNNSVKHNKNL